MICSSKLGTKARNSFKLLEERIFKVHGEKYNYDLAIYKGRHTKIDILCEVHGVFSQTPHNHLLGRGCKQCSVLAQTNTHDDFLSKAKVVHNDTYDYSLVQYTKATDKVPIICNLHGVFEQRPKGHLKGQGCPSCGKLRSLSKYLDVPTTLYFLLVSNGKDSAYKLGITTNTIEYRYKSDTSCGITISKILSVTFNSGLEAYLYEQYLLSLFCKYKYTGKPILKYGGNSELFTYDISNLILNELGKLDENTMFK